VGGRLDAGELFSSR